MADQAPQDELAVSRLYTFMDEPREYALYFLEGQRLVRDLALVHALQGEAFSYLRDAVLSVQPCVTLLDGGEQLGFYIDSESPWFRLKIEAHHSGGVRCSLMPENLDSCPDSVTGIVRAARRRPAAVQPYVSVLQLERAPLGEIVNRVLHDSWQVPCAVHVSSVADQSVMLHQMPPLRSDDPSRFSPEALVARLDGLASGLKPLLARALQSEAEIVDAFTALGFHLLSSRAVELTCSCSHERVVLALAMLADPQEAFDPAEDHAKVTCEYCKTTYVVRRSEVVPGSETRH